MFGVTGSQAARTALAATTTSAVNHLSFMGVHFPGLDLETFEIKAMSCTLAVPVTKHAPASLLFVVLCDLVCRVDCPPYLLGYPVFCLHVNLIVRVFGHGESPSARRLCTAGAAQRFELKGFPTWTKSGIRKAQSLIESRHARSTVTRVTYQDHLINGRRGQLHPYDKCTPSGSAITCRRGQSLSDSHSQYGDSDSFFGWLATSCANEIPFDHDGRSEG